ncbi:MAG: hypothetical protein RJQ09_21335 [Cyclobacteriaceae bacterium]
MANPYQIWKQAKKENWTDEEYKQKLVDEGIIKKKSDWDKSVELPKNLSESYEKRIRTSHKRPTTDIRYGH